MSSVRPSRSGRVVKAGAFVRATASPRAALVLGVDAPVPADWPTISGARASDAALDHALGWTCEIRNDALYVMNPLSEGAYQAPLPALSEAWLSELRDASSTAIYLVTGVAGAWPASAGDLPSIVDAAARAAAIPAASVRSAVHADFGKRKPVARNAPCPCGSGRKYKQCHGR